MNHFVTLFPPAENVHLIKDVGQIPYQMQRHFGYRSTLVCYKNEPQYPYLENEAEGLDIKFLDDTGKTFYWENAFISYLLRYSQSIDVLNVYHLTQATMLYGMIYKYRNPDGVLYLKMDMDVNRYQEHGIRFSRNRFKDYIHQKVFHRFVKKTDIVSVETEKGLKLISDLDKKLFNKTMKMPMGLNMDTVNEQIESDLFNAKENIILTVGRIGIEAKNNELLLQALSMLDLKNWKAIFIGPVADEFKPVIETFYKENPAKKEQVIFTGAVTDRKKLWLYYAKAKLFCLTSRWESFAIVLCEAQRAGNYIIGTDAISSIDEVTHQGTFGDIIESNNAEQLVDSLRHCMEQDFYNRALMEKIVSYARKYDWSLILKKLDKKINQPIAKTKV